MGLGPAHRRGREAVSERELRADRVPARLLSTAELAAWMGVHPKTVKGYVRYQKLPYHSRVGMRYRFNLSQVSRWLELRRESCT